MDKTMLNTSTAIGQVEMRKAFMRSSPLTAVLVNSADLLGELLQLHAHEKHREDLRHRTRVNMRWLAEGSGLIKITYTPSADDNNPVNYIHEKTLLPANSNEAEETIHDPN